MAVQTKKASLAESMVNVTVNWASTLIVIQAAVAFSIFMFGRNFPVMIPLCMVAVSLAQHYIIRRPFNWYASRSQ